MVLAERSFADRQSSPRERVRLAGAAGRKPEARDAGERSGEIDVVRTQGLLAHRERARVEILRVSDPAGPGGDRTECVEIIRVRGRGRSRQPRTRRERAPQQRLGASIVSFRREQDAKCTLERHEVRVTEPERDAP